MDAPGPDTPHRRGAGALGAVGTDELPVGLAARVWWALRARPGWTLVNQVVRTNSGDAQKVRAVM